jgi:hypothetical protein
VPLKVDHETILGVLASVRMSKICKKKFRNQNARVARVIPALLNIKRGETHNLMRAKGRNPLNE